MAEKLDTELGKLKEQLNILEELTTDGRLATWLRGLGTQLPQTPSSYAPYIRKTHSTRKVQPNTQVPKTPHISTPILPA